MPTRRDTIELAAAGLAFLGLGAPNAFAAAERDADAEKFIIDNANSTLTLLADPKLSATERTSKFASVMDQIADIPGIASFALGRKRTQFDAQAYAEYSAAFREYILTAYQTQLDGYRGETVKLVGSEVRKPGDVVVKTKVSQKKKGAEDLAVNWRVKKTAAGWRLVDVFALGVWLAIEQQALYADAWDQGAGKPEAVIAYVRKSTANLRAGKPPARKTG